MRRRRMRERIRQIEQQIEAEREARHDAEIRAAGARGELRGYRSAVDTSTIAAREAARQGEPLYMGGTTR